MTKTITTAEELDALPVGSVVAWLDCDFEVDGPSVWIKSHGEWYGAGCEDPDGPSFMVDQQFHPGALTVLYRPDGVAQPTEPARVLPSRKAVRSAILIRMSAQLNYRPDLEGAVDDVLALFANAPTVEQVKAEALREAADELDRLMAIAMTPASRVGDSDKLAYHEWVEPRRSQELYATTDANWLRARADRLAPAQPTPAFEAMGLPTPEVPNVGGGQHG